MFCNTKFMVSDTNSYTHHWHSHYELLDKKELIDSCYLFLIFLDKKEFIDSCYLFLRLPLSSESDGLPDDIVSRARATAHGARVLLRSSASRPQAKGGFRGNRGNCPGSVTGTYQMIFQLVEL